MNVCVTVPEVVLPEVKIVLVDSDNEVNVVEVDVVDVLRVLVVSSVAVAVSVEVVVMVPDVKKMVLVKVVVNDVEVVVES